MGKDIFNYIKKPKIYEYRKKSCIDKLYEIIIYHSDDLNCYKNPNGELNINKIRINDGTMNYSNVILMAKINYMEAVNYFKMSNCKLYSKRKRESYTFLSRILFEEVIVKLFTAYDRTFYILNDLFELGVDNQFHNEKYKKEVKNRILQKDKKVYKRINSIFSRIINTQAKKDRDIIIHNRSIAVTTVVEDYYLKKIIVNEPLNIEELIKRIDEVCTILKENLDLINELIEKKYGE